MTHESAKNLALIVWHPHTSGHARTAHLNTVDTQPPRGQRSTQYNWRALASEASPVFSHVNGPYAMKIFK